MPRSRRAADRLRDGLETDPADPDRARRLEAARLEVLAPGTADLARRAEAGEVDRLLDRLPDDAP